MKKIFSEENKKNIFSCVRQNYLAKKTFLFGFCFFQGGIIGGNIGSLLGQWVDTITGNEDKFQKMGGKYGSTVGAMAGIAKLFIEKKQKTIGSIVTKKKKELPHRRLFFLLTCLSFCCWFVEGNFFQNRNAIKQWFLLV